MRAAEDLGQLVAPFEVFMEMSLLDTRSHRFLVSEKRALPQATTSYYDCVVLLF